MRSRLIRLRLFQVKETLPASATHLRSSNQSAETSAPQVPLRVSKKIEAKIHVKHGKPHTQLFVDVNGRKDVLDERPCVDAGTIFRHSDSVWAILI